MVYLVVFHVLKDYFKVPYILTYIKLDEKLWVKHMQMKTYMGEYAVRLRLGVQLPPSSNVNNNCTKLYWQYN